MLGCKDPEAKPPPNQGPVPAGSGVAAPPTTKATGVTSAAPAPRLDPEAAGSAFDAEIEDKQWAVETESAIKAAAPELTEVDCKERQCRGTLTATTDVELAAMTDKLSEDTSVRGTGARSVLLTAPVTKDGKVSMQIYVTYDR